MNTVSTGIRLFLVLIANHRGHLQKKEQLCIYVYYSVCLGVYVCVRERDAYVWNTLSSAPDDPKTALKGGQEKVEKVEGRRIQTDMQPGTERDLFNKAQLIPVKMIPQAHPLSVYVEISQLNDYLFLSLLCLCTV